MKGQPATFKQFNDEINDFYKYLKDNKYTDEDIRKMFAPYLSPKKTKETLSLILLPFLLAALLYSLTYFETISWHFSALGRILLIKLLPFWDWTGLKNEKCLIYKTASTAHSQRTFNCDLCENINRIDTYDDIDEQILKAKYLDLEVPVIVKSTEKWPSSTSFLALLAGNEEISRSKPCNLATNIHNGVTTVKNLLTKAELFESFFVHFQNCHFQVTKQFRSLTPRPRFVPPELSPVQYNWLVWNKNYNVSNFKPVKLVDRVTLVGQIVGSTVFRLVPRNNCAEACPVLDIKLTQGETLIFTSLWDLEYKPEMGENIAVILEMH